MARVCAVLNVPRPERGYWAKLEFGKAPARPELPEVCPGDQLFWSQDGDLPAARVRDPTVTSAPAQPRLRRAITGIHALIQGAKQHYEKGYKVEEGQLLRPYKRQLVDVTASAAGLQRALAFANDLFNALESAGRRVRFASSNHMSHRLELLAMHGGRVAPQCSEWLFSSRQSDGAPRHQGHRAGSLRSAPPSQRLREAPQLSALAIPRSSSLRLRFISTFAGCLLVNRLA
jgi:hypothetical protein